MLTPGLALLAASLLAAEPLLSRDALVKNLTRDTIVLLAAKHPRPSHVDAPEPGTFAEALAPLLPALIEAYRANQALPESDRERCTAARSGPVPKPLPALCQKWVDAERGRIAGLLRATHRAEAGLPVELSAINAHTQDTTGLMALQHAARIVALDVTALVADGQPAPAWALCVDGFALGRDVSHGSGLLGMMVSGAIVGILAAPCAAALRQLPPAGRAAAVPTLERLRDGFAGFDAVMEFERVYMSLGTFGKLLTAQERAALPARAQALATTGLFAVAPSAETARAWAHDDVYYRALLAASRSRGVARADAFGAAHARLLAAKLPEDARAGDFTEAAARFDLIRFRLEGLAFLVRTADQPKKTVRATPLPAELNLADLPDGGMELKSTKQGTIEMRLDLAVRP